MKDIISTTFLFLSLILCLSKNYAQEFPQSDIVINQLSVAEQEKIKQAANKNNIAEYLIQQNIELNSEFEKIRKLIFSSKSSDTDISSAKKKIKEIKLQIEANESKSFDLQIEANELAYSVYSVNIMFVSAKFKGATDLKKDAILNISVAENNYYEAKDLLKRQTNASNETIAENMRQTAFELQRTALQLLMEAYSIYLNFHYTVPVSKSDNEEFSLAFVFENSGLDNVFKETAFEQKNDIQTEQLDNQINNEMHIAAKEYSARNLFYKIEIGAYIIDTSNVSIYTANENFPWHKNTLGKFEDVTDVHNSVYKYFNSFFNTKMKREILIIDEFNNEMKLRNSGSLGSYEGSCDSLIMKGEINSFEILQKYFIKILGSRNDSVFITNSFFTIENNKEWTKISDTVRIVNIFTETITNTREAYNFYLTEAIAGNYNATFYIGEIYHLGLGTEIDIEKAEYYYLIAAKDGHPEAQSSLGYIYENDFFKVGEDIAKAKYWYKLSAKNGNEYAKERLKSIKDVF